MKLSRRIYTLVSVLTLGISVLFAGQSGSLNSSTALSLEDNLATPAVPHKSSAAVGRHMESISRKFAEKGITAAPRRNNEVLMFTLATDDLFVPNSDEMLSASVPTLNYFKQALVHPESYRVIVAVYGDDTGDNEYTLGLNSRRATAIRNAFGRIMADSGVKPNIDYYWFGNERFTVANNSIVNRSRNRRVEIYIVPEEHIIEASRAN